MDQAIIFEIKSICARNTEHKNMVLSDQQLFLFYLPLFAFPFFKPKEKSKKKYFPFIFLFTNIFKLIRSQLDTKKKQSIVNLESLIQHCFERIKNKKTGQSPIPDLYLKFPYFWSSLIRLPHLE